MSVCNCTKAHLIGTDGGLRHINPVYVEEMQKKGWKLVVNPKRTYYVELDRTLPSYKESQIEMEDNSDVLKVEPV